MYVFYYGLKIFMGSMKVAVYCLRSTTLFASDWALNLRIDLRSFSQLCCLCSIMIIVFHWNKHGARNVCDRVSSAVKEAKEFFHSTFTVCNYHVRIIQGKLDRLSRRSSAGCVAAEFIKICVMFVVAAIVLQVRLGDDWKFIHYMHLPLLFSCDGHLWRHKANPDESRCFVPE